MARIRFVERGSLNGPFTRKLATARRPSGSSISRRRRSADADVAKPCCRRGSPCGSGLDQATSAPQALHQAPGNECVCDRCVPITSRKRSRVRRDSVSPMSTRAMARLRSRALAVLAPSRSGSQLFTLVAVSPRAEEAAVETVLPPASLNQVGGAVVADADHLGRHLVGRETRSQRLGRHPAGTASHHRFGERQGFVPEQISRPICSRLTSRIGVLMELAAGIARSACIWA